MEHINIGENQIFIIILMIILGIFIPVYIGVIWKIKTKEPISTIFIGAAIFILFAIVLESIPKIFLFQMNNSNRINKWIFIIILVLLAGAFEEKGRLFAFKILLKNKKNKKRLFLML